MAILSACLEKVGADEGCVYMLDLTTGDYTTIASLPASPSEGRRIPVPLEGIPPSKVSKLSEFLSSVEDYSGYEELLPEGVVFYAIRGESCVGAIRIDGPQLKDLPGKLVDELVASANLLVSIYEDAFAFKLLAALQDPIDFTQSEDAFFQMIGSLIAGSSGMEFVALRELDGSALRCISLEGFGDLSERSEWDLDPIDRYPAFARALQNKCAEPVSSMDDPEHKELRAHPWCKDVKSFVAVPVLVGLETFGVLSVAARCEFEYAPIELRGFESIANGIGVSISNFRNSQRLNEQVGKYVAAATAITSVEIARFARHEASNALESATQALHTLQRKAGKSAQTEVDDVDSKLQGVREALRRIKVATAQPEADWKEIGASKVWAQARTAVTSRLQKARIEVRDPTRDVVVLAREDWLRHVFLNLLINSIEAFGEATKAEKRIELTIDKPSPRDNEYRLTYTDTAGGVIPQRLRPRADENEPVQQLVFKGGVTSKREGSGYGLWLARKIVNEHHGSINLTDYRKGITFVISLPTPEEARNRMKREGLS